MSLGENTYSIIEIARVEQERAGERTLGAGGNVSGGLCYIRRQ